MFVYVCVMVCVRMSVYRNIFAYSKRQIIEGRQQCTLNNLLHGGGGHIRMWEGFTKVLLMITIKVCGIIGKTITQPASALPQNDYSESNLIFRF